MTSTTEMDDAWLEEKQAEIDARRVTAEPNRPSLPLREALDELGASARPSAEIDPEALERLRRQASQIVIERYRTEDCMRQWLAKIGVGRRHAGVAFNEDRIPKVLRAWSESFPGSMRCGGTILHGPPGTGKTTATVWLLARAYLQSQPEVSIEQEPELGPRVTRYSLAVPKAKFVSSSKLFAAVFSREPITEYEEADLLVIDDWGQAYETEWPLAVLDGLIDLRWREMRATIVTTNLHPEPFEQLPEGSSFAERYGRVISRLCDTDGPGAVPMGGKDLRRRRA